MQFDVFICHSSKDKTIANAICKLLEKNGISCWIAPRNIKPGSHYGEEILDAIESSLSLLLILSENANESVHVRNETELGVSRGKVIFPLLIRDVQPSKALTYYIATSQWVEAWTPPLEQKINELSAVIKALPGRNKERFEKLDFIPEDGRDSKVKINDIDEANEHGGNIRTSGENGIPVVKSNSNIINTDIKSQDKRSKELLETESKNRLEELNVTLSNQLEQHSFDKAGFTISEILAIDSDHKDALNAQALLDKLQGVGIIKNFNGPGVVSDAFFFHNDQKIVAEFGGIGSITSPKPATVIIWDVDSEQKLFEFAPKKGLKPNCIALSPDEQTILFGDLNGIYMVSIKTREILASFQASWTQCISFLPEGNKAISGGSELLLWDFELGSYIHRFKGHEGRIQSLAVTPDGKKAVTGAEDATIRLWDLQKKSEIWCTEGFKVNMQCIAISPDGRQILAGGNKIIRWLDLNTGKEILSFTGHKGYTLSVSFSPDGLHAITGGTDNILRLWDLKTGVQLRSYNLSGSWTSAVGFSKDGRLALSSDASSVKIWALPR